MKIVDQEKVMQGGGGVVTGLAMLAIPFVGTLIAIFFLLGGAYLLGLGLKPDSKTEATIK